MYCRKCKKEIMSDHLNCPTCGKKLYKSNHSMAVLSIVIASIFILLFVFLFYSKGIAATVTRWFHDAVSFVKQCFS